MKQKIEIDFEKGLIFRISKNNIKKEVGSKDKDGYLLFNLYGKKVRNHRFIYENYHNIKLKPEEIINHKNHILNDNRICNLEVVNHQQNMQYLSSTRSNTGFKNICYKKDRNKYNLQFSINNKVKHFGFFNTLQDAILKRNEIIEKLNREFDFKYTIIDENDNNVLYNTFFIDL